MQQILQDRRPIRVLLGTEVNMLALEAIHTVSGAIIYQEISAVEVLVMRKDQAFVSDISKVFLNPEELVRPGGRIFPEGVLDFV